MAPPRQSPRTPQPTSPKGGSFKGGGKGSPRAVPGPPSNSANRMSARGSFRSVEGSDMNSFSQYSGMSPSNRSFQDSKETQENSGRIFQNNTTRMWVHEAARRAALNDLQNGSKSTTPRYNPSSPRTPQKLTSNQRLRRGLKSTSSPQKQSSIGDVVFADRDDGGPMLGPKRVRPGVMDNAMAGTVADDCQQMYGDCAGDRSWKVTPVGKNFAHNGADHLHYESQFDPNKNEGFDKARREKRGVPHGALENSQSEVWDRCAGSPTWVESPRRKRASTCEPPERARPKEGVRVYRNSPGMYSPVDDTLFGGKYGEQSGYRGHYDGRELLKSESDGLDTHRGHFQSAAGVKTWATREDPHRMIRKNGAAINPQHHTASDAWLAPAHTGVEKSREMSTEAFRERFSGAAGSPTWAPKENADHVVGHGAPGAPCISSKKKVVIKKGEPPADGLVPAGSAGRLEQNEMFLYKDNAGGHFFETAMKRDNFRDGLKDDAYVKRHAGAAGTRTWNAPATFWNEVGAGYKGKKLPEHGQQAGQDGYKDILVFDSTPRKRSISEEPRRALISMHRISSVGHALGKELQQDPKTMIAQAHKDTYHGAAGAGSWKSDLKDPNRNKAQTPPMWQTAFDPSYAGTRSDRAKTDMCIADGNRGLQSHIHDTVPDTPYAGTRVR